MDKIDEIAEIAVLGGVGFNSHRDCENYPVKTPYGSVTAYITRINGKDIAIIPRHAKEVHIPPHRVNYRANIWAVRSLGVKRVISTNSVGSMRGHPAGSFVVLDDFIDFTRSRPSTFYDDNTVHVDVAEPYCPEIKEALKYSLNKHCFSFIAGIDTFPVITRYCFLGLHSRI